MQKKYDVFISYRRSGGFESANLIAEKLRGMGYSVFFDVESLRSGKFNEQLYKVIEQCRDFVIVLPENALERCSKADGTANEEDWIRKEVNYAMDHQKNIVPVMLAGFEWPDTMPTGLEPLSDYQAITATSHDTFDLAMHRLAGYLTSKTHKGNLLKVITGALAVVALLCVVAYMVVLQLARPVCTSVANEYAISQGLIHELRGSEEDLKTAWNAFLKNYNAALTPMRRQDLENDMLSLLRRKEATAESVRGHIHAQIELSEWDSFLLGLYGSQKEDAQALPIFVDSYVTDFDTLTNAVRRVINSHTYKPRELQNVENHMRFYEHSVNMMYYAYLQEVTKLPRKCLKTHDYLSKSWNLFPTTPLSLPQDEYERLSQMEVVKMEELLHKMQSSLDMRDNDAYELEQRIDSIDAVMETLVDATQGATLE